MEPRQLCYICEEDDARPTFQVCLCDYRVHDTCFRELVTRVESHNERCPICLKIYSTSSACHMTGCIRTVWVLLLTVAWMIALYDLCIVEYPTLFSIIVFCVIFLWSLVHLCFVLEKSCVRKIRDASKQHP